MESPAGPPPAHPALQRQTAERAPIPQDGLAHFLSEGRHVGGTGSKVPPFAERGSSLETSLEAHLEFRQPILSMH